MRVARDFDRTSGCVASVMTDFGEVNELAVTRALLSPGAGWEYLCHICVVNTGLEPAAAQLSLA